MNLRHLNLSSHDSAGQLPESISCLQKLETFALEGFEFTEVAEGFGSLASLRSLVIKDGDFDFPSNLQVWDSTAGAGCNANACSISITMTAESIKIERAFTGIVRSLDHAWRLTILLHRTTLQHYFWDCRPTHIISVALIAAHALLLLDVGDTLARPCPPLGCF